MPQTLTLTEQDIAALPGSSLPPARLWTRKEYHRLGRLGFFRGQRVELIDGEVLVMSPMNSPHAIAIVLGRDALAAAFGPGHTVRPQLPLRLGANEPHPDLAVVTGSARDDRDAPADTRLVVEVADTTLRYDLGRKAALYARYDIPEYWVLDLNTDRLVVHRQPSGGAYRLVTAHPAGATVEPLSRPGVPVAVNDLLP